MVVLPSRSRPGRRLRPSLGRLCLVALLVTVYSAGSSADDQAPPPDTTGQAAAPTDQTSPPPQNLPNASPARSVGEVTVTATRSSRGVLETPGNVTVIDRAAIERSGVHDLPELLRREAGIEVTNTTTGPPGYSVEARGFNNGSGGGSNMLVLIDGRRANEASSSDMDWALMHLDDVDHVEIVRGPTSALYGDNAVGGTIQIFTRRAEGKPEVDTHARIGTYRTWGGSLFATDGVGPLSAAVFGDFDRSDDYRERSDFKTRVGEMNLRYVPDEHIVMTVSGGYSSDDRALPGALSSVQIRQLGRRAADPSTNENFDDVRQRYAQFSLNVSPFENVLVTFSPYHRERFDHTASASNVTNSAFTFVDQPSSETNGLNTQLQFDQSILAHANRLILGIDMRRDDSSGDSTLDTPPDQFGDPAFHQTIQSQASRELVAGYLQEELRINDNLLVSGGVRYDSSRYTLNEQKETTFGGPTTNQVLSVNPAPSVWSPRAAVTYRVSDPLSAYLSYARGFRFPSLDEVAGVFASNPLLKPQTSNNYEAGLKWRSERATGGLTFYWMDVHNEIFFDSKLPPFGENINMDYIRHRGIEASFSVRPISCVEIYGSYTLDDTRIRRDNTTSDLGGRRVPITPVNRGTIGFAVNLPWYFDLGMNANFVGSRILANDLRDQFSELAPFAVYDLLVGWRPKHDALRDNPLWIDAQVTFAIRNLFNREYAEFGGLRSFSFAPTPAFYPSPTRHYEVGLTLRWKP